MLGTVPMLDGTPIVVCEASGSVLFIGTETALELIVNDRVIARETKEE